MTTVEPSIPAVFRDQARRNPDAKALVHGGDSLSYAELDRSSDALARRLREAGVGPGTFVPVVLPRSPQLVVTLLAVLKCGAAYAAVDPSWPQAHVDHLVRRLDAQVVVTDDWPGTVAPTEASDDDGPPVHVDDPAMVFFTSGTTGVPKAVVSPHRAMLRLLRDEVFAGLGPGGAMPLAAPPPWDAFGLELWSTLLSGGTSVLIDGPCLMPDTLRTAIRRHGVDTIWLTASLFNLFVDEDLDSFTGLRRVLTGGERLSVHHVRTFLASYPDIDLVNGYGPVESTVFATVHRVDSADAERPSGIPIGRPVAGTEIHIMDGDQPCAPGQTGEICVGGAGLAIEYLGEPERTAAAFVTVPIAGQDKRLYRTGDRGHRCDDGLLHFDGRLDRQVKLRGHRIELSQVETLCAQVPGVAAAVALAITDPRGNCTGLALCYTAAAGHEVTPDQVRAELSGRAPQYFVPDLIERVDRIPITTNGKVDRVALLDRIRVEPPTVDPPAGQGLAETVATVFADVLKVPAISPDDSFFRLGGNSLEAGRVSVRLSRRLGVPVPVSRVVAHPTARQLAAWLHGVDAEPEQTEGPRAEVRLDHMQAAFCLMHQFTPEDLAPLCPLVWEIAGPADIDALETALADVERRHEALRAAYVVQGGMPVAVVSGRATPVPLHRPDPADGPALDHLVRHLVHPLAIERGEIWRHAVLRSGDRTLFGIVVHHVAFDGWAQTILARDLSTAYAARVRGDSPQFDSPAPTLRQVSEELRRQHDGVAAAEQRRFWAQELVGLPGLDVPVDPSGAAVPISFTVPAEELARCDAIANDVGCTRFTVLLAAFAQALHRVTGQDSIGVGVPVAKRGSDILDQALTCAIDTVCLPLRGLGEVHPTTLLGSVHRVTQRAFAAQDVPFSEVVRIANPPRSNRNPLFQAMFALQHAPPAALRLPGCATRPVHAPAPRAMAELVAEVWPAADGSAAVELSHQPEAVGVSSARAVAAAYRDCLRRLTDQAPHQLEVTGW